MNQSVSTNCEYNPNFEVKWKISDHEKNIKIIHKNVADSQSSEIFESITIHNPNDIENLEVNHVDEEDIIGEEKEDFQNLNESYEEPYVEEDEGVAYDSTDQEEENEDQDDAQREEEKVENYEENVEDTGGLQNNNDDDIEESCDLLLINDASILEKKLNQFKERQHYLEKIINQRATECGKQLGVSNYNETINFFRTKLRVK